MDEETVRILEAEIKELNTVDGDEDTDHIDGFVKSVKKQLEKISGMSDNKSQDASSTDAGSSSSARKDFQENKTSLIAEETRHRGRGDTSDIYDFTHQSRGLAVIINNEDFNADSKFGARPGSSYDATALYKTFNKLGFNVLVKTNLTAEQMVEVLKLAKDSYDHRNADCFVCSILTHGDETVSTKNVQDVRQDVLFGIDGVAVYTKTIVDLFSDKNCVGLIGKPRLFFLQACRGVKYDHGVDIELSKPSITSGCFGKTSQDKTDSKKSDIDQLDSKATKRQTSFSSSVDPPEYHQRLADSTDAKPANSKEMKEQGQGDRSFKVKGALSGVTDANKSKVPLRVVPVSPSPLYKDCLIMYATPPGHYAWRRLTGSWLVQSLCEVLSHKRMRKMSLTKALTIVSGYVAMEYQSNTLSEPQTDRKKEVPVIESMLVKDVYFTQKRR